VPVFRSLIAAALDAFDEYQHPARLLHGSCLLDNLVSNQVLLIALCCADERHGMPGILRFLLFVLIIFIP